MGHYASEMQCDKCGKLRCICPPKKEKSKGEWVIHPLTYKAIKATKLIEQMKKSKKDETAFEWMIRTHDLENRIYWMLHYPTKAMADAAGQEKYENAVSDARKALTKLEAIMPSKKLRDR